MDLNIIKNTIEKVLKSFGLTLTEETDLEAKAVNFSDPVTVDGFKKNKVYMSLSSFENKNTYMSFIFYDEIKACPEVFKILNDINNEILWFRAYLDDNKLNLEYDFNFADQTHLADTISNVVYSFIGSDTVSSVNPIFDYCL